MNIDEVFIEKAEPYYNTMVMMINDLVDDEYYNQMDHMIEKRNEAIREKQACAEEFLYERPTKAWAAK